MRHPNTIYVSPDNSPGFKTLIRNQDQELNKLKISFVKTDEFNKNANAVIDRGCQELEEEIKRLSPEGEKITLAILKLAIMNLNSKLRRRGTISAFEINSSRDQNTGEHLPLSDEKLRSNQLQVRKSHETNIPKIKPILVGDTVTIKNKTDKHKANDMFVVTGKNDEKVKVQKILHPLKNVPGKIMSKTYETDEIRLRMIHRPKPIDDNDDEEENVYDVDIIKVQDKNQDSWNPIDQRFFARDDDSEDETIPDDQPRVTNDDVVTEPVAASDEIQIEAVIVDENSGLEWDDSPEQYELKQANSSSDDYLDFVLEPKILFPEEGKEIEPEADTTESLTSETSSEVFNVQETPTTPVKPKLVRNNAFRKKNKTPRKFRKRVTPASSPRVTRSQTTDSQG